MATDNVIFKCFVNFFASGVAWNGELSAQNGERPIRSWLPAINEPPVYQLNGKFYFTPSWYKYFDELSKRLGGINGLSVTQITEQVDSTRSQLTAVQDVAAATLNYAAGIAETADANRQVCANNGLTGASSIPLTPTPPRGFLEN